MSCRRGLEDGKEYRPPNEALAFSPPIRRGELLWDRYGVCIERGAPGEEGETVDLQPRVVPFEFLPLSLIA